MVFRCELCDNFLSMFQFSHLCNTCYKIRTIVKCYDEKAVLENLEDNFLISEKRKEEVEKEDKEFFKNEEKRLEAEFHKEVKELQEKKVQKLETIKEGIEDKAEEVVDKVLGTPKPNVIHNTRNKKKNKNDNRETSSE